MTNRLTYIDRLRILATILVVLHHTAIIYGGSGDWLDSIPEKTFYYFKWIALAGLLALPVMIVISLSQTKELLPFLGGLTWQAFPLLKFAVTGFSAVCCVFIIAYPIRSLPGLRKII